MKKRIIVKLGTSILTRSRGVSGSVLESLIGDICGLIKGGAEFILVTSGAIGEGMKELGWDKGRRR